MVTAAAGHKADGTLTPGVTGSVKKREKCCTVLINDKSEQNCQRWKLC